MIIETNNQSIILSGDFSSKASAKTIWCARITGQSDRFGLNRCFIDADVEYTGYGKGTKRFELDLTIPAIYETPDEYIVVDPTIVLKNGTRGWMKNPGEDRIYKMARMLDEGHSVSEARAATVVRAAAKV